jgi:hypothetical protein
VKRLKLKTRGKVFALFELIGTVAMAVPECGDMIQKTHQSHRACLAKTCTEQNSGLLILELVKSDNEI